MQEFAALKLEIEDLQKCIENGESQIEAARASLNELKEELDRVEKEYELQKVSLLRGGHNFDHINLD